MSPEGKSSNFVFFDLSKLDPVSAGAFLKDWSQRPASEGFPPGSRCHWILSPNRGLDLLSAEGPGQDFLRRRLASGDRLFCTNPTGFDWNHLFPSEAEAELRLLRSGPHEIALFLESTPDAPGWIPALDGPVFRASGPGLTVHWGQRSLCLPWASREHPTHRGVWWLIPGQAMLSALPPAPWRDLPEALPSLLPAEHKRPEPPLPPEAPSPLLKKTLVAVAEHRRSTMPLPLHQAVLFRPQDYPGLGTKEAVDFEETLGGIRKRSLVANMQGQTDLAEGSLRVRFLGGKLTRVEDKQGHVLCSGAETSLDWGGTRHPFTVNSAFSFEGDYSWGLRQSLVLQHEDLSEPGRAIFDYYFVEESREFFVAATVRWPRWKAPVTITRWAPLELSLFDVSWMAPLTTRTVWPDGRTVDQIHRQERSGVLVGTDFVFTGPGSLALGFPQNQTPRPHFLPWRLVPSWGGRTLTVNPEGGRGPRPSAEFEGIEEHFSFYLLPSDQAKLPFAVTRKQAVELIPPYVTDADAPHS